MARIGKVLVSLGLITPDQLRQAVSAQIVYGGRLGTNLVELGFIELDALAQGLSRRRAMPAALGGHFDRCDREIQARLPAAIAVRWKAVPLGYLAHDPSRIAIAAMDPLPDDGRRTIAAFLDVPSDCLVVALAPELRIRYHLERAYQITRPTRFLRLRGAEPTHLPEPPSDEQSDVEIEVIPAGADDDVDTEVVDDSDDAAVREPAPGSDPALDPGVAPPLALDYQQAPPQDDEVGRGQRRFVPSLGDGSSAAVLARIAVRQVQTEPMLVAVEARDRPRPSNATELLRAVRRAESRDQVAELVVNGLADLGELEAVAILVVRPPMALGWRGFCPAGESVIDSLAVPLDQASCLAAIHTAATASCGSIDPTQATVIDERMWAVLGTPPPVEVMVAPIMLGGQVLCLLYGHASRPLEAARELGPALAASAGIAFGRLLRAAQR